MNLTGTALLWHRQDWSSESCECDAVGTQRVSPAGQLADHTAGIKITVGERRVGHEQSTHCSARAPKMCLCATTAVQSSGIFFFKMKKGSEINFPQAMKKSMWELHV